MLHSMIVPFISGAGLSIGLVLVFGPQNLFLLRQGLRHQYPIISILSSIVCETILVAVGVFGLGQVIQTHDWLALAFGVGGSVFLYYYGWQTLQRARRNDYADPAISDANSPLKVMMIAASFSLLNPGVWLDTVVVIGGLSTQFAWPGPLVFAAGALTTSSIWFASLVYGGKLLRPLFERPGAWKWFDYIVCIVMTILATGLLWHTFDQ
ncbi:MAG TPA: amino acid transporter [Rhodospirillaceae bacterium]|nr:amino acid transporter [Rhodospirillaceae bacterium]